MKWPSELVIVRHAESQYNVLKNLNLPRIPIDDNVPGPNQSQPNDIGADLNRLPKIDEE